MEYEPYDRNNRKISIGDWVRLVEIPPDVKTMPDETQIVFEKALEKTFKVEGFNEYGCAELDLTKKVARYNTIWVEPHFLLLSRKKKSDMENNITVYEKPTCTTCRNLNKLFEENGVDYRKVNYFIEPLTAEKLKDLLSKADLSAFDVVRKNEAVYKDLKIAEVSDEDELINLIVENPGILQRPIVEVGDRAVLARPIERALELIKSAE